MAIRAEIKVDRALRKLVRLENAIRKAGDATVEQLADLGKYKAKSIVPIYSGRTHDYIRALKTRSKDGVVARVQARNPTASDGHRRNVANFNLVRWMHTSPRAVRHIYSGDHKFMYTTRDYLNRIKKGVAEGRFRNINLR